MMLETIELLRKTPIKITASSFYEGECRLRFDDSSMSITWNWDSVNDSITLNYADWGLDVEVFILGCHSFFMHTGLTESNIKTATDAQIVVITQFNQKDLEQRKALF